MANIGSVALCTTGIVLGGLVLGCLGDRRERYESRLTGAPVGPVGPGECAALGDLTIDSPSTEAERIFNLVVPEHLATLDDLFGRYARGEASVYEGAFDARDNLGSIDTWRADGEMSGDAIASLLLAGDLIWDGRTTEGYALTVVRPEDAVRVRFAQVAGAPDVTQASLVTPYNTSYGVTGACAGCLTSLAAMPGEIDVSGLVATGVYGDGSPLEVRASGSLVRIDPAALTADDLLALAVTRGVAPLSLARGDGELVTSIETALVEPVPVPPGVGRADFQPDECERRTRYTVELFVDDDCLIRFGVRNLEVLEQQTCCTDREQIAGCLPGLTECFGS